MSGFTAEWLTLREPADAAARSASVTEAVIATLRSIHRPRVLDLGCGSGSNVRFLSARLPSASWRLVDDDPALLERAVEGVVTPVDARLADLRFIDQRLVGECDLVTASALLDLVSESWLERLVDLCRRQRVAVLWALNYNGRIACQPVDLDDDLVRDLVNRHQRTDKGFGPALGPSAGARAVALLGEAGYDVHWATSDWQLDETFTELQRQLVAGWARAATEISAEASPRIAAWKSRRLAAIDAGDSRIIVGHDDVGGVPRAGLSPGMLHSDFDANFNLNSEF